MNFLCDVFDELFVEPHLLGVLDLTVQYLLPSAGLIDGHIVGVFDGTDIFRDSHSLAQQFEDLCVDDVELLAHTLQVGGGCVAELSHLEIVEQSSEVGEG